MPCVFHRGDRPLRGIGVLTCLAVLVVCLLTSKGAAAVAGSDGSCGLAARLSERRCGRAGEHQPFGRLGRVASECRRETAEE